MERKYPECKTLLPVSMQHARLGWGWLEGSRTGRTLPAIKCLAWNPSGKYGLRISALCVCILCTYYFIPGNYSAVLVGMTLSPLGCKEVARYPATNSTSREEGGSCSGVSSVCPCYWKPRASQGLPYITPFTLRPRGLSGQPSFSRA